MAEVLRSDSFCPTESSTPTVPSGFICGYPVRTGNIYTQQASRSLQGRAINRACSYWGYINGLDSDQNIPYGLCRNPFHPFLSTSRTLSSGKRVRFTMRMNGCQKHAQVRETVLRKGLPNGWYNPVELWPTSRKRKKDWQDGEESRSLLDLLYCGRHHRMHRYVVPKSDALICDSCKRVFRSGETSLCCRWCDLDECLSCAAGRCPLGHRLQRVLVKNESQMYKCDICRQLPSIGSKLFGCSKCDWDICASCLEAAYGRTTKRDSATCPLGHLMRCSTTMSKLRCDSCKKKLKRYRKHMSCSKCDYDVCSTCVPINQSNVIKPQLASGPGLE